MTNLERINMKWIDIDGDFPNHKELVLVDISVGISIPAIYYTNSSFSGFYKYTTYYELENTGFGSVYHKVCLKEKHRILNVKRWKLIPTL